ncbi:uncharacterized protein BO66DRAFT_436894 [Aspergillus aculeatinus CBS 121060]|uniref:Uncharacterized protein n=1 Tax=Aspergillus aculeatinus CBS 121060 TaxID=1448322 RepID=A0ACD1HEY5_9EURO|nr:hypothetical protein BO66DRAFT_436894 [Aspergillus aculeatinus CBS 121060]RAH72032.1 hypothetical protein BO66DRAFT_436894 [Aspergillus aculeatinus CBS 121060]
MVPAAGQPVKVGVNSIQAGGNYVYSTSSSPEVFARFPVDNNAAATGPVEIIGSGFFFDGVAPSANGTADLTTTPPDEFMLAVGGSTAAAIDQERSVLYVATSGALEPAKVAAISLQMFPMTPRCIQLFWLWLF